MFELLAKQDNSGRGFVMKLSGGNHEIECSFKKFNWPINPFCMTLTWVVIFAFLFTTACTTTKAIRTQPDSLPNEFEEG